MNIAEFRKQHPQYNDMSDADLAEALHKKSYSDMPRAEFDAAFGVAQPTQPQVAVEKKDTGPQGLQGKELFLRRLGILGRAGLTGVSGTIGLLGDAAHLTRKNLFGATGPYPTEVIQQGMDKLGLPRPVTQDEKVANEMVGLATGIFLDPVNVFTNATRAAGATAAAMERYNTLKAAKDAGFKLSPSEAGGSMTGRALEGFAGSDLTERLIRQKNLKVGDAGIRAAAGLAPDAAINRANITKAIQETERLTYQPIEGLGRITNGKVYRQALDDVVKGYNNASFPNVHPPKDISDLVAAHRVRSFDAADAVDRIKRLRDEASSAYNTGDHALARAKRGIADALENSIELNLTKDPRFAATKGPQMLRDFEAGRAKMAKQYVAKDAVIEGSGSADLSKVAKALQDQGKPLTGELGVMGRFANTAPDMVGRPGGAELPISRWESARMYGSPLAGAGAAVAGSPVAGAALMSYPALAFATRELLASGLGQALLAPVKRPGAPLPLAFRAAPSAYALGTGLFEGE